MRGSVSERSVVTVRKNAECPSLSPDGTRVVYKKRVGEPPAWRYHVLDLASGRETPLAETRAVDDQAEWLDGDHVLYHVGEEVWKVPADGTGRPPSCSWPPLTRPPWPATTSRTGGSRTPEGGPNFIE